MPADEILRYVMSFIGGGFAVAVGNWVHSSRAVQKQQELTQLREQLSGLYGPVYFVTQQNDRLLGLSSKIQGAYGAEFIDKKYSDDPLTQERVKAQAKATIDLDNEYVNQIVANNKKILDTLGKGWHLVDADDVAAFSDFQVDCVRLETEVRGKMRIQTPDPIYKALGNISFIRPALIKRVAEKVASKQARIRELLRPWWHCRS